MKEGTVKKLVHLSGQTELPSANIVGGHNFHGYGYIESTEGDEVYFDHSAVAGRGFDMLSEGDRVVFDLEDLEHKRATSVVLPA